MPSGMADHLFPSPPQPIIILLHDHLAFHISSTPNLHLVPSLFLPLTVSPARPSSSLSFPPCLFSLVFILVHVLSHTLSCPCHYCPRPPQSSSKTLPLASAS